MKEDIIFNYVIYHNHCFDGYTSFISLLLADKVSKDAYIYPDYPSTKLLPPKIEGKNIIIMDVAYSSQLIKEISKKANIVYFMDHHITIYEDIKNLHLESKHKIIYDVNKSGAGIVWDFFHHKKRPLIIDLIEDHDIGRWSDERTKMFNAYLEVHMNTIPNNENIKLWKKLFNNKYLLSLLKDGEKYLVYKNHLIEQNSKTIEMASFPSYNLVNKKIFDDTIKYKCAVLNNACPSISLLGSYIMQNMEQYDFVAFYHHKFNNNKLIISLRSNGVDVGSIAKKLGGGGHTYAAAFSYDGSIYDLFDKISN
jgi:uncharacterized protein